MTFCAKSRAHQWGLWVCAALVVSAVYVVVSRFLIGSVSLNLLDPARYRLALPLAVLFGLFAWETRWDGVRRDGGTGGGKTTCGGRRNSTAGASEALSSEGESLLTDQKREDAKPSSPGQEAFGAPRRDQRPPSASTAPAQPKVEPESGESLYKQARSLPHQRIPDYERDGLYLDILGDAAAKGYSPALLKLGEYAMRRAVWVEAYYWTWQARRNGMHGLSPMLREIRTNWARNGFPREETNVSPLFTVEAGSVGRALLHIDSGHEAAAAREFLRTHYPDLL